MPAVDLCPSCNWPLTPKWSERFKAYGITCLHLTVYAETEARASELWQKGWKEYVEESK